MTPEQRERARWTRINRVYGITQNEYNTLDLGHCPICLRVWTAKVRPVVDHDHKDKWVRGIICLACNHRIVGNHRDSATLRRVADYLDTFPRTYLVPIKKKRKKPSRRT